MKRDGIKFKLATSGALALRVCVLAAAASLGGAQLFASPISGTVNINGSVGVTGSLIDFQLPIGGPNGAFIVGDTGNTGSFAGLAGTTGSILDLNVAAQPVGSSFLLPGFITFAAMPNIRFDLTSIAAGTFPGTQCAAAPAAGQICTPAGSPFNLSNSSATSSTENFSVSGNVVNRETGELSTFTGIFTTQFPNQSFQDLLSVLSAGGTVNSTYSASFSATVTPAGVPEPSTWLLVSVGMVCVFFSSRRSRKAARG